MKREPVSVGRIVHYTSLGSAPQDGFQKYPPECRAAIVTAVKDLATGEVSMTVFNEEGFHQPKSILFDAGSLELNGQHAPGTWHWPERTSAPLVGGAEGNEL